MYLGLGLRFCRSVKLRLGLRFCRRVNRMQEITIQPSRKRMPGKKGVATVSIDGRILEAAEAVEAVNAGLSFVFMLGNLTLREKRRSRLDLLLVIWNGRQATATSGIERVPRRAYRVLRWDLRCGIERVGAGGPFQKLQTGVTFPDSSNGGASVRGGPAASLSVLSSNRTYDY